MARAPRGRAGQRQPVANPVDRRRHGHGAGIVACLTGVATILTRGHPEALLHLTFNPDLWAAAGMLVFVVYTMAMRRVPGPDTARAVHGDGHRRHAGTAAGRRRRDRAGGWPPLHERTLPWIAALVLLTGIGAYLGYNVSLKRNGPAPTSASICLTPAYAAGRPCR